MTAIPKSMQAQQNRDRNLPQYIPLLRPSSEALFLHFARYPTWIRANAPQVIRRAEESQAAHHYGIAKWKVDNKDYYRRMGRRLSHM
jgi:hypothetical protein